MIKGNNSAERRNSSGLTPILSKRGQLKIQEMAFVLLALVVLGGIVLIFTIRLQSNKISAEVNSLNQQRVLSLRDKIVALPEIKCARGACIDEDKVNIMRGYDLGYLFQGVSEAKIVQIYPSDKEIVLYRAAGRTNSTISYSTFINLCKQEQTGTTFEYNCGLALLLLSTGPVN